MGSQRIKELFLISKQVADSEVLLQQLISQIEGRSRPSLLTGFRSALDKVQLPDLGITPDKESTHFVPDIITYTSIYETQSLSVCFFCMAQGTAIPMHDHPQMTALTRVLRGKLRYKLADMQGKEDTDVYRIREVRSGEVAAPDTFTLTPESGNLHQFEALESTVILDIFIPNYSELRDVTYFEEVSADQVSPTKPRNLHFREVLYTGHAYALG